MMSSKNVSVGKNASFQAEKSISLLKCCAAAKTVRYKI